MGPTDTEVNRYDQSDKSRVTQLLKKVPKDKSAYKKLFPIVYQELKKLAYSKLEQERQDITFTETELVHEVYLKMISQDCTLEAEGKSHFMAIAARCMRQILIDHARKKKAEKRGGNKGDVTYIDQLLKIHHQAEELISLDKKLDELATLNQRLADVVELRYFGKLTIYQTAKALDISESTVKRDWAKARGWLYKELKA